MERSIFVPNHLARYTRPENNSRFLICCKTFDSSEKISNKRIGLNFHSDCYNFLVEVSRRMNNTFTPFIQEIVHFDAKFVADEEIWLVQTQITLKSQGNQILILSWTAVLMTCSWSM